jgi:cysteine-S-conjugate beta-lyase
VTVSPQLLEVPPLSQLRRRRSEKWRSYPPDVLPLPVAETDFPLAEPIRDVLQTALDLSDTGYPAAGPELANALAEFAAGRWGWQVDPTSVVAAADVSVAAVELLRVLCRPGDAVVISPPVYPPFFGWVPEAGARLVEVPLRCSDTDGSWRLDLPGLERAFRERPAAYLLCNPHNPVGRVHDPDELRELIRLAAANGVTIISDEVHGPLVLPGATFTPLLTLPGASDVAVTLTSASKAWNLAGLKCAAIVRGSERLRPVMDRLPAEMPSRVGHFGVLAGVAAWTQGGTWLDRLLVTLAQRRRELGEHLAVRLPWVRWHAPEATYLAWLDCREIGTGNEPRELFLERSRVGLEPGLTFGDVGSGYVRLNFATSAEILGEAIERLAGVLPTGSLRVVTGE